MKRNLQRWIVCFLVLCLAYLPICGIAEQAAQPMRIITLAPSHTEILYALGVQDAIVGWTQYEDYPPEVLLSEGWVPYDEYAFVSIEEELQKQRAVVGSFTYFNEDLIEALQPTLILAVEPLQESIANSLSEKGYNVLWFCPETLDDVFDMMIAIGEATGAKEIAEAIVAGQQEEIAMIREITKDLPTVKVYFEISHYGPWALGAGSPMDQIVAYAGGENIFADIQALAFPAENADIVDRNPDVILTPLWPNAGRDEVTTVREIVMREGYETTEAVQNSRVYFYDSSLLKRPGPRQVTAILKLAHLLHPYYFDNPPNSVSPWELGKIDALYLPPAPLH